MEDSHGIGAHMIIAVIQQKIGTWGRDQRFVSVHATQKRQGTEKRYNKYKKQGDKETDVYM